MKLSGTGVALITPFKKDMGIDFDALASIIDHVIAGGVEYLVVLGTTGEAPTLSKDEKKKIYQFAAKHAAGRVPCVAGIGGNNTPEVASDMASFNIKGYEAILSVSPYYNKPNQEGIFNHYSHISKTSRLPVILYNVPGRSGSNMTAATSLRIASRCKNVVAIKEASGNAEQFMDILVAKPNDFEVISGDDNLTLPFLSMGMCGVISVIANAYPKQFTTMVRLGLNGNMAEAKLLHFHLYGMMKSLFMDGSPGGVKYVMSKMKLCNNLVRQPLAVVGKDAMAALDKAMSDIK
ncbi:MAG: 4-hydroxy-tetrahydrodipicolinate synthase [Bacteroidota bacterium]